LNKVIIPDTNVLLHSPNAIFKFNPHDIIIPILVIEEIDTFKKGLNETGQNARQVSRILDNFRSRGSLAEGVKVFPDKEQSSKLSVYFKNGEGVTLPDGFSYNNDNKILKIALAIQKKNPDKQIVLVTNDSNLRIKSDVLGVKVEEFDEMKVDIGDLYTGNESYKIDDESLARFYEANKTKVNKKFIHNEYLKLINNEKTILAKYKNDKLLPLKYFNSEKLWGISPRNYEQYFALDALMDEKIKLVTLVGQAGTGKTLLAIVAGLTKTIDENKYHKLLVSRPVFPLGKDIGFLPGSIEEKLNPWMQPIYDNLDFIVHGNKKTSMKTYKELLLQGMIEIEALTYIRGRSIPNQFLIIDEAQNLTPHELKTIITRAGENTKVVLTGDPYQIDNPYLDTNNNGLIYVVEKFKNEKISAHITLVKGERSELASLAAKIL